MSTRSDSSSPDVLAPPADLQYLISPAPVRPVPGRRSWFTPSKYQTPRKRPRSSASPTKTSHSFRLDDLMLKSTPRKNRQGSLSPSKLQSESNVSPWRIKVTVEAEHEDEMNNNGSVARKRFKSGTTTTKIPLKDGEEVSLLSAKRRRGRPRKSDIQEQSATPSRDSPGRTPGRTPGPATASAVKRKRGRPRKSLPEPEVVESVETDHLTPAEPTQREPTPLNLAVEGDAADLSSDDGISSPAPFTYETGTGHINFTSPSPIRSENRQVELSEPPRKMARILEGDTELAPSKSLSPDREENTMHAGHTPRPRRIYPTPTSSSLIDGENPGDDPSRAAPSSEREVNMSGVISDPTNEHREFDSIMESEGFSMVSLDTLPSAKSLASARSLPSAKQQVRHSNLNPSKPALKPFFERQTPGSSDRANRRASGLNFKAAEDQAVTSSPQNQPAAGQRPMVSSSLPPASDSSNKKGASRSTTTPAENILYPQLPDAPAQAVQSATTAKKRSFPSLAKVVRAGIALQGILRRQRRGSKLQSPFSSPGRSGTREMSEDSDGPRRRLEHLFSGFGLETQRELRAGLRFGEELARQREAEERRLREEQNIESSTRDNAAAVEARGASFEAATPEQSRENKPETGRLDSEMARRQAEWQREREAISREIEMANSSKVIVIDSDVEMSQKPEEEEEEEEEEDYEAEQGVPDDGDNDDDDDGDYDIWQQEAHASRLNESSISHHQEDNPPEPDRGPASSPWKSGQSVADSDNGENLPSILWDSPAKQSGFPSLGKSRLRKLKEEEVDLSALLRRQDTPNRRRYYGNSSPQTRASQQQLSSEAHHPSSPAKPAASSPQQPEQVSPPQRQSVSRSPSLPLDEFSSPEQRSQATESPDRSSERSADEGYCRWEESPGPRDSASQQSGDEYPDGGHLDYEHPDDERPDEELSENDDLEPSHADISGDRSTDQTQTPQPARQISAPPASSWFRRLTNNFTPRFWRMGNSQSPEKQSPSKHLSPQFDNEPLEELPEEEEEEEDDDEEEEEMPDEEHHEEPMEESDEELDEEPDEEPPEGASEDDEQLPEEERDQEPLEDDEQLPDASPTPSPQQSQVAETPLPEPEQISASPTLKLQPQRQNIIQPSGKPPLAVSGYFTDDHYYALRRLYRLAQRSPELFPYYPTPSREDIIGDWLWTSDGAYGLPVTELQFAIVDRFMEELADGDIQNGGTGEIGWSEEELYKRLFSIIIGEQIRRQRKAQALEEEEREREREREREELMSNEPARRASVASWRQ